MTVKTVRFNKEEELMLKKVLAYYRTDFSSCVKELFTEKLEDLQDIGIIRRIQEGKRGDYLTAGDMDKLF